MDYQLITTDQTLDERCQQARQHRWVAVDTEFVRTRTYYPQLGLIQMFDGEALTLIDPLAISDWQPFIDLLADKPVTKLLHACSEDLEVFWHSFGQMPVPMIDTQVLAAFTGRALSCGFAVLVAETLEVTLDKTESRTDWLARPLTERQCDYAAADVYWLLPMAHKLIAETQQAGWWSQAGQECEALCQRRREVTDHELAYRDIANAWQLCTRQLACLQRLASWRLNKARERDMAVNFVVREEHLWQVARYMPGSLGELEQLGLSGPEIRYHGRSLLDKVQEAQDLPDEALPAPVLNLIDSPGYRQMFKALKEQIQLTATKTGLSGELLASRRQINHLISVAWGVTPPAREPELISGWRGALFGTELRAKLGQHEGETHL
ncbi:ribonuclease D [Candidatus Sodalis endolongispinus]|uniref:Ribonuclease D n=1 Tax=Candidatus Sodalis endolongispinus TaxID=2812662 RepID=A0ABS5YES9_9GAMM|nr:ribonuclease D [Candidatus Sodalis endolongispinus]MBT9433050.1 ribonuclease D [Candidatus Sodalis endolongispinus]